MHKVYSQILQIAGDVVQARGERHSATQAHAEHVEHIRQAVLDLM